MGLYLIDMTEIDRPFESYTPDLIPHPLKFICRAVASLFQPFHTGAESFHSTHFQSPLDGDIEPVTNWPLEAEAVAMPRTWEDYANSGHAILDHAHPPQPPEAA